MVVRKEGGKVNDLQLAAQRADSVYGSLSVLCDFQPEVNPATELNLLMHKSDQNRNFKERERYRKRLIDISRNEVEYEREKALQSAMRICNQANLYFDLESIVRLTAPHGIAMPATIRTAAYLKQLSEFTEGFFQCVARQDDPDEYVANSPLPSKKIVSDWIMECKVERNTLVAQYLPKDQSEEDVATHSNVEDMASVEWITRADFTRATGLSVRNVGRLIAAKKLKEHPRPGYAKQKRFRINEIPIEYHTNVRAFVAKQAGNQGV